LSTVNGHEALSLWPKTSPWNSLCWLCLALFISAGLSLWTTMALCCRCPACWTGLQRLFGYWHLLQYGSFTLLDTLQWVLRGCPLLRPWLGFSLQFRTWLLGGFGHLSCVAICTYALGFLYHNLIFCRLYFPLWVGSCINVVFSNVLCARVCFLGTLSPLTLLHCHVLDPLVCAAVLLAHGCLSPLAFPELPPVWWGRLLDIYLLHHLSSISQCVSPCSHCTLFVLTGCFPVCLVTSELLSRVLFSLL